MFEEFNEPQPDKRVWWTQICPKHEKQPSPFASLIKSGCSNCKYVEKFKVDGEKLESEFCRYPNKQTE